MKRIVLSLSALLGCASTPDQLPRTQGISACWSKFGATVQERTQATLAERKCEQQCEETDEIDDLMDGVTNGTPTSGTAVPCERACPPPNEPEEIKVAAAAWLETSPECHAHAQVLARRTRAERQKAELASRQQDWTDAPPIDEFDRETHRRKNESTPGEVEVKERMGKQAIVLRDLVVPVIRERDIALVYTVELLMVLSDGSAEVGISPKFRHDNEWVWLKCHDAGLWKNEPWTSAPGVGGSDGHWIHVEATHNGDVKDGRVSEWVMFSVTLDTLRELSAAEHSGGQVCTEKFELTADQKAAIASFTNYQSPKDGGSID